MDNATPRAPTPQGFGPSMNERLPLLERSVMSEAQRAAADAIIHGPRKAIFGPFVPLLQTPALMERIGKTGEALRFDGTCRSACGNLQSASSRAKPAISSSGRPMLHWQSRRGFPPQRSTSFPPAADRESLKPTKR